MNTMKLRFKSKITSTVYKRGGTLAGKKYSVGKIIGGRIYMHINYIQLLPWEAQVARDRAQMELDRKIKCVSYCPKMNSYTFATSADFDCSYEPTVGDMITIQITEKDQLLVGDLKWSDSIWHHKWMWVGDDYDGFDIRDSYKWSQKYTQYISRPSGSLTKWCEQLNAVPELQ
jgi:hypothetical protein